MNGAQSKRPEADALRITEREPAAREPGSSRVKRVQWQRPVVIGAAGQVGGALQTVLQERGVRKVKLASRERRPGWMQVDLASLRSPEEAMEALADADPDLLLCAGAMTFVDGCEEQPELAFRTNAHGPAALASYAHWRGIPLVFYSTDYVFDGSAHAPGPYTERDRPRPLSVYGESKLMGERAILRVNPEALILRTSWVYGPDAAGKNFIHSLRRQLEAGNTFRVPSDQVSTPTLNLDLAEATLALLDARAHGVVHVTGPEMFSRFELAKAVAGHFGLDTRLIQGETTASLGQRARRPLHSGLQSVRLAELAPSFRMRPLAEGLHLTAQAQTLMPV